MSLVQATTTRLPLVRHNQTTGANKYGNNPLRPQDLSSQYISSNAASNILLGDYGDRQTSHTYVSFPEIINVQAVEIYASATAEMSWSKAPFERENGGGATSTIEPPQGSIYYSIDGLDVSDGSKVWTPLVEFSVIDVGSGVGGQGAGFDIDKDKPTGRWEYTDGTGSVDSADFGYKGVSFPETYGRVNVSTKDSNLKNLILRFSGTSERVKAIYYTAPEDGGRQVFGEASSVCFLTPVDYYVYVIQDGPSAYDRAPLIPNITTQPTSSGFISLALNETATITDSSVVVSSTGTITYQWYKNGSSISGATTNDYEISNAQLSDAGTYHCEVINTVSGKSVKLNTQPIVVTVGTGLARPAIFTSSTDAFWIDKDKLADSNPSTYASIGVPPIPISYTQIGGSNYTSSYDEDYNVYATFKYRPLSSGKLTVKYQKIGTTNSPNTIASALAQYSTDYTAGIPSWTTFATALGTGGTTDVLVYELTSLPASADDLAIRFGKQNLKGYNGSPTPVSGNISTYSTGNGDPWTNPADAINSTGTSVSGIATAQTITFEEIYSCTTVATAGALTISGTATYDLSSAVDSAAGIFGSVNYVVGSALLEISYSLNNGSSWTTGFTRSVGVGVKGLEVPSPENKTGTNVAFSLTPSETDVDLTKVKIKLALTLGFESITSDDGYGNTEYIEAGGSGNATIKNLGLSYTPPTIELSTAEFRVNEVYLEYDVDQALTDTVSLSSNKTSVSSGGAVVLTPRFSTGSGSINNGVGTVTSGTTYTVNPTVTTTYTLTVGSVTKSVTITVVAAPAATSLTAGSSTISNGSSTTLTPVFSNGTGKIGTTSGGSDITASATSGTAVTVTPTATTTYYLTVTNSLGATASTSTTVEVAATPSASLARGAAIVTNGLTTTVTPTFANGTAVIGTSGQDSSNIANPATSGTPVTVTPTSSATTTYTLTVTATATGQKTTATASIQAIAAPTITSFTVNGGASANVTVGNTVTLLGNFTGSGTVNNSVGSITTNTNKVITISSTGAATYTLTASNTATTPATVTSNVTITGYAAPTATSLVAAASSITNGNSTTLTPTFSNGTGKIGTTAGGSEVTASATSGTSVTVSPTSTTTYYLTVTNVPGTTASTSTTITVVAAPVATSLTAGASTVTNGSSTTLTPVFSNGTGKIGTSAGGNQVTASATSGTTVTVTPANGATTTYYLTVTNSLESTASTSTSITAVPAPTITSFVSSKSSITNGNSLTLTPTFSNGTGKIGTTAGGSQVTASATSGSPITISPTSTTTYYLTVTNAAGTSVSQNLTVTVKPIPTASLVATDHEITAGEEIIITPTYTGSEGGSATINGIGSVTSGIGYYVTPVTTPTTSYTLTVNNGLSDTGSTATSTVEITVAPFPEATSLTFGTSSLLRGSSTTITPVFSGGVGKIGTTSGGTEITASATSGVGITISPSISTTYYLTVTNTIGFSQSRSSALQVHVRPNSFTSPGSLTNITDVSTGDETTYGYYYNELESSEGYIQFAPLIISGQVYIKYRKYNEVGYKGPTDLWITEPVGVGAYLKYTTDGTTYNNQIAAVSSGDTVDSSIKSSSFSFSGNLNDLKFSVGHGRSYGTYVQCMIFGPANPEPPYDRGCEQYGSEIPTQNEAGFYIYDVYVVV